MLFLRISWMGLVWMMGVASVAQAASDSGLIFHASFETSATADLATGPAEPIWPRALRHVEGAKGQAIALRREQSTLVYQMPGNAQLTAGTLSFFWRMDEAIDQAEFPVLNLGCVQSLYFGRWMRLYMASGRLVFQQIDSHLSSRRARFGLGDFQPQPHTWYHIALAWDQARGLGVYLDGQPVRVIERPWFLDATVNQLSLGQHSTAYTPSGRQRTARNMAFDELHVFDRWLSDEAIAALARGQAADVLPPSPAADPAALAAWRRQVFGWETEAALPRVAGESDGGGGLGLRQVGVANARDVLRPEITAFDGQLASAWQRSGYREAGQALQIELEAGERFDVVQSFAQGNFALQKAGRPLWAWQRAEPGFAFGVLAEPASPESLAVRSHDAGGQLMTLALFERDTFAAVRERGLGTGTWFDASLTPDTGLDAALERQVQAVFSAGDRMLLRADTASAATVAPPLRLPAAGAVQIFGPAAADRRGWTALSVDLHLAEPAAAQVLRVEVMDPLNRIRRTLRADVALPAAAAGARWRLAIDLRDLVLPPGARPWLSLQFSEGAVLACGTSQVGFCLTDVATALPQFSADQRLLARDVFSSLSEARPWGWDPQRVGWLGFLHAILTELRTLEPGDAELAAYWHWIHPSDPKPRLALSEPAEARLPAWAHDLGETQPLFQQAAHWWIDQRMTPDGEFGASDGINDDTDLIQDWLNIDRMVGPDEKIRDAVRRVADNSWQHSMQDGLGRSTDTLHHYEWGLNAQALMAVMDYGCPVAIERLMKTVSRFEELMIPTEGGRVFRSQRFGYSWVRTSGPDGWDHWANALTLQPAMLLAWYSDHPLARAALLDWAAAMIHHTRATLDQQRRSLQGVRVHGPSGQARLGGTTHGFFSAIWAAYELGGDPAVLDFIGEMIEWDLQFSDRPTQTRAVFARYLNEAGRVPEQQARYGRIAEKGRAFLPDETLWRESLHNQAYRQLDWFHHHWQLTGDAAWLDEGMKLSRNDMTWSLPMLTTAGQSTDRVWLPQRLANRIALGDLAILRNELYPGNAVSWENASGRLAPLVQAHHRSELSVVIHNLEDRPVSVRMPIWRLEHGRYQVRRLATARAREVVTETEETLQRGSALDLDLPAGGALVVDVRQNESLADHRARPDVAVTYRDAAMDAASGELTVQVHSIGSQPTGPIRFEARQGERVLHATTLASLDAPLDLQPRKIAVRIPGVDPAQPVIVSVAVAAEEITPRNNTMRWETR